MRRPYRETFTASSGTICRTKNGSRPNRLVPSAKASSSDGKLAESFHSFVRALTGARSKKTSAEAEESSRLFGWLSPRKSAG